MDGCCYIGEAGGFPNRSIVAGLVDLSILKNRIFLSPKFMDGKKYHGSYFLYCTEKTNERRWFRIVDSWNVKLFRERNFVLAFTNCDKVSLYLNDKIIGTQELNRFKQCRIELESSV
jgi:hypothetical protein